MDSGLSATCQLFGHKHWKASPHWHLQQLATPHSKERMKEPLKSSTSTTYLRKIMENLSARWFPFLFWNFAFVFLNFLGIDNRQLCFSLSKAQFTLRWYPCQSFKLPDLFCLVILVIFSASSFASSMGMYQKKIQKVSQSVVLLAP